MRVSFKTLMTAGLALAGSVIVQPAPAEAQPYWGPHHRAGWGYRPYAYAPRAYYGPRYYRGYRSAYYGPRRHYGYPYYRAYRRSNGGAIAAGLIGGLALGAIVSAATNPYYAPVYYAPPRCFFERRRIVTPYGRVIVRRVRTCY